MEPGSVVVVKLQCGVREAWGKPFEAFRRPNQVMEDEGREGGGGRSSNVGDKQGQNYNHRLREQWSRGRTGRTGLNTKTVHLLTFSWIYALLSLNPI